MAADLSIETKAISARQLSHYCWAKLIARVYETDPLLCGHCGGRMKIIAFVMQASEIRQILAHVGLPVEAPRTHPARGPPQSDLWASATACGLLANGKSMRRIQMQPIKISRCIGKPLISASEWRK
jgi:hypothetical protein